MAYLDDALLMERVMGARLRKPHWARALGAKPGAPDALPRQACAGRNP